MVLLYFFNYKQGDGFQENSEYNARNFYVHLNYEITPQTSISTEFTRFNYLAHQPGGLPIFSSTKILIKATEQEIGLKWTGTFGMCH